MKQSLFRAILAVALAFTGLGVAAQQNTNIEERVKQEAAEFDNTKGVNCLVLSQGAGLGMVKTAFKAKFGNAFMKDVTSMVIIDYSDASAEVCSALHSKIASIAEQLQDFTPDNEDAKDGKYVKSYATVQGETNISDFMIITEDGKDKIFLFIGGILNTDKLELNM